MKIKSKSMFTQVSENKAKKGRYRELQLISCLSTSMDVGGRQSLASSLILRCMVPPSSQLFENTKFNVKKICLSSPIAFELTAFAKIRMYALIVETRKPEIVSNKTQFEVFTCQRQWTLEVGNPSHPLLFYDVWFLQVLNCSRIQNLM